MLYSTFLLKDNIHLNVYVLREYEDRDGGINLAIRIEQEDHAENFSEWRLPDVACVKSFGFSESDIFKVENYLISNESIIWDDWREHKNARTA